MNEAPAAPLTRGERVIAFIETFCRTPEGTHYGDPIRLDPFQRKFVLDVYDNPKGTEVGILSTAKKNGKTSLIACLVLAHVVGPEQVPNSQIVCGAMSREQAGLVFDHCVKMVRMSAALSQRVHLVPSRKRLYGLTSNVEFRALAARAQNTQGISPVLAIFDELGQVRGPHSEFFDSVFTAQGAYEEALMLIISVQAAEDADLLSVMIDDARDGGNPHTVCHLYEAPKDCGLKDRAGWEKSNPALGTFRSLSDLAKLADKAERIPSFAPTFRNYNLNQRVETISPFLPRDLWKKGDRPLVEHSGIVEVWGGLDLSAINDLTAFAAVWEAGGQWNASLTFWTPEEGLKDRALRDKAPYDVWVQQGHLLLTPGPTVDYDFVAEQLLSDIAPTAKFRGIAFDRWRIEVFKAALKRKEASDSFVNLMHPFGQGFRDMSPAVDALETDALKGKLAHAAHPVLAMCARNARIIRDEAGNRKLDKRMRFGRIDGIVALVMARGLAATSLKPREAEHQLFVV